MVHSLYENHLRGIMQVVLIKMAIQSKVMYICKHTSQKELAIQ